VSIIIKKIFLNGEKKDILIKGNKIAEIGDDIICNDAQVVDGKDKAVIPGLINAHTHAAMTLMRGFSDDLPVQQWLEKKIWPLEKHITEEDVYWGAKLACLEMIKTGTTFFNDMYWYFHSTAKAVEEMGLRASLSSVFIDMFDQKLAAEQMRSNERLFEESRKYSSKIHFMLGPHSIYTVSEKTLRWIKEFADTHNCMIHIHISESHKEVEDCLKSHGKRPVEYLADIGLLSPNLILAHCIWIDDNEIELLKEFNVNVVHLPTSNMKLSSGVFPYKKLRKKGIMTGLGTDGCASNNNLDMIEEMKTASILAKLDSMDPTEMPTNEIFDIATKNGSDIFKINGGVIEEGKLADMALIDLNNCFMTPLYNFESNLVYSANSSCVDTTICDGKILMQNGKVDGEDEILQKANETARSLVNRL